MAGEIDVDGLLQRVDAALDDGVAGREPLAAFDADGTLWDGDIGDLAFARAAAAGMLVDDVVRAPLAAWAARYEVELPTRLDDMVAWLHAEIATEAFFRRGLSRGMNLDEVKEDVYAMQAWIYAGRTAAELSSYGDALFASGFAARIFPNVSRLFVGLRARGVRVVIVSASPRELVVAGARHLGVDASFVRGMEIAIGDDGCFLPRVARAVYGAGKVRVLHADFACASPLVSCGDGVTTTDRQLLASARVAVAVEPRGSSLVAARAHPSMWILRWDGGAGPSSTTGGS